MNTSVEAAAAIEQAIDSLLRIRTMGSLLILITAEHEPPPDWSSISMTGRIIADFSEDAMDALDGAVRAPCTIRQ